MRVFFALFIVFALHQQAFAQETSAKLTRGPYLQLATPSSIHIVWRTVGDATPIVRYGLELQHQDQAVEGAAVFR
jgi:hypothetical protein